MKACSSNEMNNNSHNSAISKSKNKRWTKQETDRLRIALKIIANPETDEEWVTISKFVGRHGGPECKIKLQKIQDKANKLTPLYGHATDYKIRNANINAKKDSVDNYNLNADFFADKFDKDTSLEINPEDSLLLAMLTPENKWSCPRRSFFLKSICNVLSPHSDGSPCTDTSIDD